MRIEEYETLQLCKDIKQVMRDIGQSSAVAISGLLAARLYEMGWRHGSTIVDQEAACTAVDYSFRSGAIMFATKIKSKMPKLDEGEYFSASDIGELLSDAIDATFRGAVLRLAEKLKQCSYCDNCFKDGKWHRYVFIEDIDATAKKFLESET